MKTKPFLNRANWMYLGLALLLLHSLAWASPAQAQTPRPPVNIDDGGQSSGGDGDSGHSATPLPSRTGVYGFVYNYSTAAYEGGVKVIATGPGWQGEGVTDSNGYYHIRELGFGQAILNLALPPGAFAAAPNWPTKLVEATGHQQDLGFYWRTPNSVPVLLSGALEGSQLVIQIKNGTGQPATGGRVEIVTPANLRIAPLIKANQGQVSDFAASRTQLEPGDIMPGETATISASLIPTGVAAQAEGVVQVLFTYQEQLSPQAIELTVSEALLSAEFSPDAANSQAGLPQPEPAPAAASSAQTQAQNEAVAPAEMLAQPAASQTAAENDGLLPETGAETSTVNVAVLALTALILATLGIGGWQSVRGRKA